MSSDGLRRLLGLDRPILRIIITRHGERADFKIGKDWLRQTRNGTDGRVPHLTTRPIFEDYNYDSSLTTEGEHQSASIGRKLARLGLPIDYCYSSPAYRSVQTANKILEGQGRQAVPINIEPGMFECPAWYKGKPLPFIPPRDLAADPKFNVNAGYRPIYDAVDASEDENLYYRRSRLLIRSIIETHKHQGGTVLLSGHGGSIEAVTRGLRGLLQRRGDPQRLIQEALRVNYCNFAILERDANTRQWVVRSGGTDPRGARLSGQTHIPLFAATTESVLRAKLIPLAFAGGRAGRKVAGRRHQHARHYP